MWTLLLASVLSAAPKVEVQTLGGQVLAGPLVELTTERLTLEMPQGPVSLPTDDLMGLSPSDQPERPAASGDLPRVYVDLVDSSSLVAQDYWAREGRAQITLVGGQTVELPTLAVATVRLQPQSEAVAAEWSRILQNQLDSDLLVVRKGESIDYHKGILRGVTQSEVRFELDGDLLPVKRVRVAGFAYYHPSGRELPEAVCRITDAAGSQWSAQSLALLENLEWITPAGVKIVQPLSQLKRIDFSRGKIVYLSDLKPESVAWTPYFGSDVDQAVVAQLYAPRQDRNLASNPLQLGGQQYRKGLAMHTRTSLVYRLPGRFRRFQATVGIDDELRPRGSLRLVIRGDDRVLLETRVTGRDAPLPVDLDLTGVRRLTILADFGGELDAGNHLLLCDARIIK